MDRKITFKQAINEALAQEMQRDKTVIVMGEDVAGGSGTNGQMDAWGGVLGVTKGLWESFGDRVMDTPITESAFVGAAIGAATAGLRPVVELMFVDFMGVCFDQIYNQAAKFRYMFGGKAVTPVVIRTMIGAGFRAAAQHSQSLYPIFTHIPGLKCVVPSTPYDAKGYSRKRSATMTRLFSLSIRCCTRCRGKFPKNRTPFRLARPTTSAKATTSPS